VPPGEQRVNASISSEPIVIENFFGRLRNQFQIMGCRWPEREELYPKVLEICCGLINFDIGPPAGNWSRATDGRSHFQTLSLGRRLPMKRMKKGIQIEQNTSETCSWQTLLTV
jgi:hypothetical protein